MRITALDDETAAPSIIGGQDTWGWTAAQGHDPGRLPQLRRHQPETRLRHPPAQQVASRMAATTAVTLSPYNGRTEEVNNKTKNDQTQMFGRASLELLRYRILLG